MSKPNNHVDYGKLSTPEPYTALVYTSMNMGDKAKCSKKYTLWDSAHYCELFGKCCLVLLVCSLSDSSRNGVKNLERTVRVLYS